MTSLRSLASSLRRHLSVLTAALVVLAASCGGQSDAPDPPADSTDPCRSASGASTASAASAATPPGGQKVYAGEPARFDAPAAAAGSSVQWQRSTDDGSTWVDLLGATSAKLIVDTFRQGVSWFRAVVTQGGSTAISEPEKLTVKSACLSLLAGQTEPRTSLLGAAVDAAGNLYVSDWANGRILKITPSGTETTLARNVRALGLASDAAGNVFAAADTAILKVAPDGAVSLLAGQADQPGNIDGTGADARFRNAGGVAVDAAGNVFVADAGNCSVRRVSPAGTVSTLASMPDRCEYPPPSAILFDFPTAIAVDAAGTVYAAGLGAVRMISPSGRVTTLAGVPGKIGSADGPANDARFGWIGGIAVDATGTVYATDSFNWTLRKISPSGVASTLAGLPGTPGSADGTSTAARFVGPHGLALGPAGSLLVADVTKVRAVTPAGEVSTTAVVWAAHADGAGDQARFAAPSGLAADAADNVYVADTENHVIRKITARGEVTTLAGRPGESGSADGAGTEARFRGPSGVAVDSVGNVYVADTGNYTVRVIRPDGRVATLAGQAGQYGQDNGQGSAARFARPTSLAVDSSGNVYVADLRVIRKLTPAGMVTNFRGCCDLVYAVAIDAGDNFFVAGWGDASPSVARYAPDGSFRGGVSGGPREVGPQYSYFLDNTLGPIAVGARGTVYVIEPLGRIVRVSFDSAYFGPNPQAFDGAYVGSVPQAAVVSRREWPYGPGLKLGENGTLYAPSGVAVLSGNRLAIATKDAVVIASWP